MGNIYAGAISPTISSGLLLINDSSSFKIPIVRVSLLIGGQLVWQKASKWSMDWIDSNIWSLRIIVTDINDVIIKYMTQFGPINWLDNESSIQEVSYKWVEFEIQTRKMWEKQIFMKSKNNRLWTIKWTHKKVYRDVKMVQVKYRRWPKAWYP